MAPAAANLSASAEPPPPPVGVRSTHPDSPAARDSLGTVPTVTRIAAERGLQAAEVEFRRTHGGSLAFVLGTQGLAALLVVALAAVVLIYRRRTRGALDAREDVDGASKARRWLPKRGMRLRALAVLPWRIASSTVAMVLRRLGRDVSGIAPSTERGAECGERGGAAAGHDGSAGAAAGTAHKRVPSLSRMPQSPGGFELVGLSKRMRVTAPPVLLGSTSSPATVLSSDALLNLRVELPSPHAVHHEWHLLYSTDQHGCSLRTFHNRCDGRATTLLAVLDASGAVFGGFVEEAWRSERRYIGNGNTFMWRVGGGGRIERYGWSRADTNFVLCANDCIAFGSAPPALYLDASFEKGASSASPTYDNAVLAGSTDFAVIKVEVWALGHAL